MAYRPLACCCVLLLLACGRTDTEGDDMAQQAPWHLWGNQYPINLVASGAPADVISQQLVNVNYGRPDSWTWLFWAKVIRSTNPGGAGLVQVRFNLTTGIGTTRLTIPDFVIFAWNPLPAGTPLRWTTNATDSENRIAGDIPAQDLILNVNAIITGGAAPGDAVDLLVGAVVAPKSHVRPEWYEGEFPGGEDRPR